MHGCSLLQAMLSISNYGIYAGREGAKVPWQGSLCAKSRARHSA